MMPRHLLYLIGQPGSGKSTLAAALTAGVSHRDETEPFAHRIYSTVPAVHELGAHRSAFSGTDALSLSVQPRVLDWLHTEQPPYVLAEGDRLASASFFDGALRFGYQVQIVRLLVSTAVADHRRAARAATLGAKPQNPAWLKGRITKVARLSESFSRYVTELNADQPADRVLAQMLALHHPVVTVLRSGS